LLKNFNQSCLVFYSHVLLSRLDKKACCVCDLVR
jgi:hypothetical protein